MDDDINKKTGSGFQTSTDLATELEKKITQIEKENVEEHTQNRGSQIGLPYLNLKTTLINDTALLLVTEDKARAGKIAVISKDGKTLRVAVIDPNLDETKNALAELGKLGYETMLYIVSSVSMEHAWSKYVRHREAEEKDPSTIVVGESLDEAVQSKLKNLKDIKENLTSLPITAVMDAIVSGALHIGASDIHLEPGPEEIRMRYRLDGVLVDVLRFPASKYPEVLSRIKLHSGAKLNVHDTPQDGRFAVKQPDKEIEVRVSILPGPDGEGVVMRLLDPSSIRQKLGHLGMREDLLETMKHLLMKTTGAILTTGPTGSGKTTTLYAFVEHVNKPEIKVITLEDPIEYRIEGITQTQVDHYAGFTFADGLRSIVRQDPDVILVGEIRDFETAEMTMQAALTGHLVFSTIHANSATATIPRLIDLGVKPVTIAPAVNATMSQRLVRRICADCTVKEKVKKEDFEFLKQHLSNLPEKIPTPLLEESLEIYYPKKCQECNFTGYKGRTGVYEIALIDSDMEHLIMQNSPASELENLAVSKGMVTLLQDGLLKVIKEETTVEEVIRAIGT